MHNNQTLIINKAMTDSSVPSNCGSWPIFSKALECNMQHQLGDESPKWQSEFLHPKTQTFHNIAPKTQVPRNESGQKKKDLEQK